MTDDPYEPVRERARNRAHRAEERALEARARYEATSRLRVLERHRRRGWYRLWVETTFAWYARWGALTRETAYWRHRRAMKKALL